MAVAMAFDQPVFVLGALKLQQHLPQFLNRAEPSDPEQVFLEGPDEASAQPLLSGARTNAGELSAPRNASALIGDKGYDSDSFRQALRGLSIAPCIPGRSNRKRPVLYDTALYKQSNRIEQMFGRLKDRRSIVTR
jgi:transposase